MNGEKIEEASQKAEVFAQNLEKKFSNENSPNFDSNHHHTVESIIKTRLLERDFNNKQKEATPFTIGELNKALMQSNSKTSLDPVGVNNA